jgi:GTP 3',8-cyclase
VTECFCDSCNRIRVTPQGGIRACLADDSEVDLRALLRSGATDAELLDAVRLSLWGKKETHRFDIEGGSVTRKQMISIGG